MQRKDIQSIEVQYFERTDKPSTKIKLESCITREEALFIKDLITPHPDVFMVRCWTNKNSYI